MPVRRPSLILGLGLLPALCLPVLWGCDAAAPEPPPPPSVEAQAAIRDAGGAPEAELGRAIDGLFDPDAVGETRALLVMKRGSVIVERYAGGADAKTRLPGWSAGQCVTALMIGQLVSDGRLRLNESAPVAAWSRSGDPRGEITLKQLVQMRSGLRHSESDEAERRADRARMLFLDGRDDMAAYAEAQPLTAPAGSRFAFSAATGVILADIAGDVLSEGHHPERRRKAVAEYLRTRVLAPLRIDSAIVGYDRAGTMIGAGMIHATARDWGKLAEFLRKTGSVGGAQVLPRRWIEFMLTPSARHPGYGAGVWLNREEPGSAAVLFPGKASPDLFACVGDYGQYVIGSPGQLLTVVRLGVSNREQTAAVHDRLGDLIALFPGN